jgi:Protein of unknown function (DUF3592)
MGFKITLIVGILFLLLSLFLFRKSVLFIKSNNRSIATVIEITQSGTTTKTSYHGVFKFVTDAGKTVVFEEKSGTSPPSWQVGEKVKVAYNPNKTDQVIVLSYFGAFFGASICLAIAAALIVIGGGYYLTLPFLNK